MEKIVTSQSTQKVDKRILRFVGSDSSVDCYSRVFKVSGWKLKDYRKNPIVLFAHNSDGVAIAKTKRVWVDQAKKKLMFDVEFPTADISETGDSLYKLYKNGYMKAVSVGCRPNPEKTEWVENAKTNGPSVIFSEQTLVELSLCASPANKNTLITSSMQEDILDKKILTSTALDDLLEVCDFKEEDVGPENDNEVLETRIAELELQIAKMSEENTDSNDDVELDDAYTEIYKAFNYEVEVTDEIIEAFKE